MNNFIAAMYSVIQKAGEEFHNPRHAVCVCWFCSNDCIITLCLQIYCHSWFDMLILWC